MTDERQAGLLALALAQVPAQEERTKPPLIADDLAATLGVTTGASMATWQRWIAECPDLPAFRRALGVESKEEGAG